MSNQFYSYLAKNIISYFKNKKINAGDKFNIQFERDEEVKFMYEELRKNSIPLVYRTRIGTEYRSFCINVLGVKIIVACNDEQTTDDFLIRLRNIVGEIEIFKNYAILFIHNTNLDSLIKGTESLQKEGMPLNPKTLIKDIKNNIQKSEFKSEDKYVLDFSLDKMMYEDNTSIFQYANILDILEKKHIDKDNYNEFGLFFDDNLSSCTTKKLAMERLNDNFDMFSKIDAIHKYNNPEVELEKDFDNKGIDILKKENWKDTEYKDVKRSKEAKKSEKVVLFEEIKSLDSLPLWDRPNGETKVKLRDRNIIIFNENLIANINFEIRFDSFVKTADFKINKRNINCDYNLNVSGKRANFSLNVNPLENTYLTVKYDDSKVKYNFKVCVISCKEKLLTNIKTNYEIKDKRLITNTDSSNILLNPTEINEREVVINNQEQDVKININERINLSFEAKCDEDVDFIKVNIKLNNSTISISKEEEKYRPTKISGNRVWKLKRERQQSFLYLGNNKIINGTYEYFATDEFRENIEIEKKIISTKSIHSTLNNEKFVDEEIEIDENIRNSYNDLIRYFEDNNLLPSLAYYDETLIDLSKKYIENVIYVLNSIENDEVLSKSQKNLAKLATIYKEDSSKEVLLTPLHPINICYQLSINKNLKDEIIDDEILKLLSSKYLMPYTYKESNLYKVIEQNHSPEWTYFVNNDVNRYKGSRNFVTKLTREKIDEFVSHFTYLFKNDSKIKIKLINLGDCNEVLQGVFDYYVKKINNSVEKLPIMDIYIYGEDVSAFEEISFYDNIEEIKNNFDLNFKLNDKTDEDLINIFRENVKCYKKNKNDEIYQYSHLTFYEMDSDITVTSSSMEDINTGVSLNGLISGVSSMYLKDSYRTGFGTKFINKENNLLILSKRFNSLAKSIGTKDPFNNNLSITTSIEDTNRMLLDKIYNSSHWITFIDPKIDLNFFKNDEKNKELLIIHYSDQYTSSSGYDAITVTRRSKQYEVIIDEFLRSKSIPRKESTIYDIINYFNAINGDWLLRLISSRSQFPREKLSILSAIKISLAYFSHRDILWVPISLEEILRVSSGAGLNQREGLFSVKNLLGKNESHSDDLLLVGIENNNENIKIYFHPVEVKIGENNESVIQKAIEQARKTKKLLIDNLCDIEFKDAIYRNFIMQLVLVSCEKLRLYNVVDDKKLEEILNGKIRAKLLNDDYEISDELEKYIGMGSVISFKKNTFFSQDIRNIENITIIELSEQEGYNTIVENIDNLTKKYVNGQSDFDSSKMIYNLHNKDLNTFNKTIDYVALEKEENELEFTSNKDIELCNENKSSNEVQVKNELSNDNIEEKESEYIKNIEIMFGTIKDTKQPLYWYPTNTNEVLHTNTGIIGTMGTGKTQFTKSLITQMYREQKYNLDSKDIGMLIFDYKGDYIDDEFVKATNAKVYNIYHLPYNPLSILIPERAKPLLPLHTANSLKETISNSFNLGIKQETLLRDLIIEAYESKGIIKNNNETWEKTAPTIHDVCNIYFSREDIKEDSLYASLINLYEFEIFEPNGEKTKNLFDIIDGVTVIDLSGYDEAIQNLVVAITLDIFYNQMLVVGESKQENGFRQLNKMILVDEADNFLSKNFISIKKILKEGRMFGVGTILSTQLLSHFATTENEYQNYILTWIIHNVSDLNNKDVRYIFNTKNKTEEDNIYNKIKSLKKHESLVKIPKENNPIFIKDKAFWELSE